MDPVAEFNKHVEAGELELVQTEIQQDAEVIHTFTLQPREWGDEMWLPLHRAAYHGHSDIVELLLKHGARPDSRTRFRTPFHARCTAMHFAAAGGYADILSMLIEAGGDVNVLNTENASPLHWACRYGRATAVAMLLRHRAQIEMRDHDDRTSLHLAVLGDHAEVSGGDPSEVVPILIEHGANVDATCPKEPASFTPLHRCVTLGVDRFACAQILIKAQANTDLRDPVREKTALQLAQDQHAAGDEAMKQYIELLQS